MANKPHDTPRTPLVVRIAIALVAVTLVVIGAAVTLVLLSKFYTGGAPGCGIEENGIRVCLSASKSHASATDEITLTTIIVNSGLTPANYTFNSGCIEPDMTYNGEEGTLASQSCTMAIEEVTILPLSSKSFSETISGSKLKDGVNTVQADWQSYKSNTLTIERNPVSSESLASQFTTCQSQKDNIEYGQIPSYCESISIVQQDYLERGAGYTCTEWKNIVAKAHLALPCTMVMDIGTAYVYVPRNDPKLDEYKKSLKELAEIAD